MNRLQWHSFVTAALLFTATSAVQSAPMTFGQTPPGAGAKEPAPNVIVSVDDSGSMGADGMTTLRQALRDTFGSSSSLAENRIRMAWQSMNKCPSLGTSSTACGTFNGMRYLGGTHRTRFDAWVTSLTHNGGTPGHLMMDNAGQYLSAPISDVNSPWAANPGTTQAPILSCRKNYHIFMTDGGWNSGTSDTSQHIDTSRTNNGTRIVRGGGNADNTTKVLPPPSGRTYDITSNQTRLYRDSWGGTTTTANGNQTTLSTLADIAFHYWSTDLQTGLANDVRPTNNRTTPETFVATNGTSTTLEPFWNPRNNPATWQNMVTYTIGFNSAASWSGDPDWGTDTFSGDLPNLINGLNTWTSPFCSGSNTGTGNRPCDGSTGYSNSGTSPRIDGRRMDLWHAALNGRGRFVPAPDSQALVDAFQNILSDILSQTTKPLVSIATSATRLTTGAFAYIAKYNSENWSGDLSAYPLDSKTGLPGLTATWTASTEMDKTSLADFNPATRVVLTHNGTVGKAFQWASISTAQKSALRNGTVDSIEVGQARLNYLRGDRSKEQRETSGYLRNRASRLGDIVNSNIWYTGKPLRMDTDYSGHKAFRSSYANRTPVLYVGGNDGMLHGFNANTGKEVLAYVPLGAYANLRSYTLPSYDHRFFVDGHPFTGDAYTGSSWKTMLVGAMGAGGKGYFILDVTNPSNFTNPGTGDSSIVVLDTTVTTNPDVGHIFAAPTLDNSTQSISQQIVKLNNNRWAVILGNGYNSTNERPVLLIQYLDGAKELKTIVANSDSGQANGLGAPRAVDIDGNGTMDVVYAGDLKGNLWKFNLITTNDSLWGVSAWSGETVCSNTTSCQPLFVATTSSDATQPITSAPIALNHPFGGKQIMFGTGKDLIASDRNTTSPQDQTIYSIWDKTTYLLTSGVLSSNGSGASISNGRSALIEQTVTGTDSGGLVTTSTNTVTYSISDASAKRGWFFDLPVSGERVLSNPLYLGESTVLVGSVVPKQAIVGESCDLSSAVDKGYITALNAISGKTGSTPLFGEVAPTATRTEFGTGEFASLTDIKNGRQTATSTDANCTGSDCSSGNSGASGSSEERGAMCVAGTGCEGPSCTLGVDCPDTTCSGPDCVCNGSICEVFCQGPSCGPGGGSASNCTGPRCRSSQCGTVIPGAIVDLCIPGLFGARTDWRELR